MLQPEEYASLIKEGNLPMYLPTICEIASPTATGSAKLPDAGVSYPTIIGLGLGLLLIFGALFLAL